MSEIDSLNELLGAQITLALIEAFGGTRLSVPPIAPGASHKIAQAVGVEGAALMSTYYGGMTLRLPMARAWRLDMYEKAGLTNKEKARRLGVTETAVYAMKKRARTPVSQSSFSFID